MKHGFTQKGRTERQAVQPADQPHPHARPRPNGPGPHDGPPPATFGGERPAKHHLRFTGTWGRTRPDGLDKRGVDTNLEPPAANHAAKAVGNAKLFQRQDGTSHRAVPQHRTVRFGHGKKACLVGLQKRGKRRHVVKMDSTELRTSGSRSKSAAAAFCSSCDNLVAPTIVLVTGATLWHHANATWAGWSP